MEVKVRIEFRDAIRKLDRLPEAASGKATAAALNKVADKAKTEMVRAITQEFAIGRDQINPRMRIQRATSKRGQGGLVAILDPFASRRRGRSLNLIRFLERKVTLAEGRRRAKRGTLGQLGFRIRRGSAVKQIPGAFIGNQGRTVFARIGKARLPIKALQTIDVPQMFNTRRIHDRVVSRIRRELPVEIDRAIRFVLSRS